MIQLMATLQEQINAAPAGSTLKISGEHIGNFTVNKPITIEGPALLSSDNADPTVFIPPKTQGVTLRGLEISTSAKQIYDIVRIGTPQTSVLADVPRDITIEGCDIHGQPTLDSQRGVAANGANIVIRGSKIREIHGRGYDTQAICAWNGPGPFRILNNYLEAAGENVMFGGSPPSISGLVPTDIQILGNHFFKPLTWKVGHSTYAGIHWTVKNLLEFKNAFNVIVDGNVLENCWTDAQIGYAVLCTVRSEDGKTPWATVENIRFTNNILRNSEQGFQLLGMDAIPSKRGNTIRISNNRFEQIANRFLTMSGFYDVTIEHNTHEQGGNIFVLHGEVSQGFVYINNATYRHPNGYGFFGDGVGEGKAALEAFVPGYRVEGNVIAGAVERLYPVGNFFPPDLTTLANFKGTDGLVPGYNALAPQPAPSPTPTPTPVPSPSPTPTPAPLLPRIVARSLSPTLSTREQQINDIEAKEGLRFLVCSGQICYFERRP